MVEIKTKKLERLCQSLNKLITSLKTNKTKNFIVCTSLNGQDNP